MPEPQSRTMPHRSRGQRSGQRSRVQQRSSRTILHQTVQQSRNPRHTAHRKRWQKTRRATFHRRKRLILRVIQVAQRRRQTHRQILAEPQANRGNLKRRQIRSRRMVHLSRRARIQRQSRPHPRLSAWWPKQKHLLPRSTCRPRKGWCAGRRMQCNRWPSTRRSSRQ